MKRALFLCLLFTLCCGFSYSQVRIVGNEALKDSVLHCAKPYKLVYIFCDYCQTSVERFPELVEALNGNAEVALFPIGAQGEEELEAYFERNRFCAEVYLINQERKRRRIDIDI